jgi:hypothetical protein
VLPTPTLPAPVAATLDAVRALGVAARDDDLERRLVEVPTTQVSACHPSDEASVVGAPSSPHERAAWLVGLRRIVDAAEAAFTIVLADFDAAGDGESLHAAASTQAWLRGALGMASGEASERVRMARAIRGELSAAVEALHGPPGLTPRGPDAVSDASGDESTDKSGEDSSNAEGGDHPPGLIDPASPPNVSDDAYLSYEHLRSIQRTLRALPPSTRDEAATVLLGLGQQLGVDDLRAAARHLREVVDPDGSVKQCEEDFSRRWLSIAPMLDGMHSLAGVLDAETAGRLTSALAPFMVPTGEDDDRRPDQRRADGLAEIVDTAVRSGELPTLSGSSVSIQVAVPLTTLTGDGGHPARFNGAQRSPVWFTSLTAARLACEASVRRLVFDPAGVPLDLGRQVRTFTGPQRQALASRDRGCRFPGCARPVMHTDAHHLVPWAQGGASDLANGLLLCRFHHRKVHEGGWRIVPSDHVRAANGSLRFIGPRDQQLESIVPAARGPSP